MELTPRKREILRMVVEEYVTSGRPVGSRWLVERSEIELSSSTVRGELAELESLGLLTHPHTSAGRVPTDNGYRIYSQDLVDRVESRPGPFALDLTSMRTELEQALRRTTEALADATHLLALVSAPPLETAAVKHVEVLQLKPNTVIVVVITASGEVSKRVVEFEVAVDAGLVDWARSYLEETAVDRRLSTTALRRLLEEPSLSASERRFLDAIRPAFEDLLSHEGQFFVGGAANMLGDARGAELEACQRLLEALEHRATALALLSEALDPLRTVVRVGPELDGTDLHDVSVVGSTYGLDNRSLGAVALVGPQRMDYEKAVRSVRAAAFELSRLVQEVYGSS
jgi:heat-inducible transcriptional repressor